jgi:hypothetical protein
MKTARISLAIVSGILLALGYAASSDHDQLSVSRILAGLLMGSVMAISMIRHPERISRKVLFFIVVPLLFALVIHEIRTGTRAEAIITVAVSIAFMGVQFAFAALTVDPSSGSSTRGGSSIPGSED